MDRAKSYAIPFLVCLCLLGMGIVIDSEVQERTDKTLVSHVLPPDNQEAPLVASAEPVEEEIPIDQLPDTGGAWHLSVFVHDNWESIPSEKRLMSFFSTDRRLQKLTGKGPYTEQGSQVHQHVYTPSDPMFQHRYYKKIGRLPAIRLQAHDGRVVYKVGTTHPIPGSAKKLGNDIARAIRVEREYRNACPFPRPRPEPEPTPQPKPDPMPIPDMVPDVTPDGDEEVVDDGEDEELSSNQIIGIGVALLLLSGIGAALVSAKKDALG